MVSKYRAVQQQKNSALSKLFRPKCRNGENTNLQELARPAVAAKPANSQSAGETMVTVTLQKAAGQRDPATALRDLLGEVARGSQSAFAKLYGLTNRKLLGVALQILRDRGLAEDVLQETYLKVWRHAASYDPAIASPMAWMATIVRHGAIDAVRKRQFETVGTDSDLVTLASDDPDPVDELDLAQRRPWALAAFAQLPEDKRRLIMLAYLGDQSRQQLSKRFGLPTNTVKTHLRRALLELRATLGLSVRRKLRSAA
jgi:RNA polymerase sigma-70 factor (ECF subfamily)